MSQRCCHLDIIDFFAADLISLLVTTEVSMGIFEACWAASFASLSAILFPAIVACPVVQCIETAKAVDCSWLRRDLICDVRTVKLVLAQFNVRIPTADWLSENICREEEKSDIFLETASSRTIRMAISSAKRIDPLAATGLVSSRPLVSSGKTITAPAPQGP